GGAICPDHDRCGSEVTAGNGGQGKSRHRRGRLERAGSAHQPRSTKRTRVGNWLATIRQLWPPGTMSTSAATPAPASANAKRLVARVVALHRRYHHLGDEALDLVAAVGGVGPLGVVVTGAVAVRGGNHEGGGSGRDHAVEDWRQAGVEHVGGAAGDPVQEVEDG